MEPPTRLTWLAKLLLDWHPFTRNVFAPFFWAGLLYAIAAGPVILGGQYALAFSRPFYVCFGGVLCELFLAYTVMLLYTHIFRDLPLALMPSEAAAAKQITDRAINSLNAHRRLLVYSYLPILVTLLILTTLSFYQILDRDGYAFLYFLDSSWYQPKSVQIYCLLSLWLLVTFTSSILYTGFWFQFCHWRMFHNLLSLNVNMSPILIYSGFAKLWLTTNISSIAMLSCNWFLLLLLDFKPHPLQMALSILITMPGVLAILWPTYNLYRLLVSNKEGRTDALLRAAEPLFGKLAPEKQLLEYSNLYHTIFVERNVGNMQASVSFTVALISFGLGLMQIMGLDIYLKALMS
jgi:hypothetical protein